MSSHTCRWLLATVVCLPVVVFSCESRENRIYSTHDERHTPLESLCNVSPQQLAEFNKLFEQARATHNTQVARRFAEAHWPLYISSNTANPVLCSASPFDDFKLLYDGNEYSLPLVTYSESNLKFNALYKGKEIGRAVFESDSEESRVCELDVDPPVDALFGGQSSFTFVSLSYSTASDSLDTISRLTEEGRAIPQTLNKRGLLLQQIGHLHESIVLFSNSIIKKPTQCEAYLLRGNTYWILKRYDSAKADYLTYSKLTKLDSSRCPLPDYIKSIISFL